MPADSDDDDGGAGGVDADGVLAIGAVRSAVLIDTVADVAAAATAFEGAFIDYVEFSWF